MDLILNADYLVFHWINSDWSNPILDVVLKWMRNEWIWFPLYLYIITFFIYNYGKNAYWLILFCFLTFGTSDSVSSHLIKKTVKRERPCRNLSVQQPVVRIRCGSGYSFTSSHATNHFAIAVFLSLTIGSVFKKIRIPLLLWASIIGVSQIYVGVHFPLDVACGSILGIFIGWLWAKVFMKYFGKILQPIGAYVIG
ncbi:MAG: phosphatase PAP2 family protein [Saprospiraceae bacterium]|jgi:membrane-associated phospholipid phosphatase|nr:phosphatase PAP2 family protein [Saprospiraceae bacterium]MBP9193427.1 phosphatase PAP2 family protein [Saprospiraceae bacterium]